MANNDSWKIYGNTIAFDRGELVFELGDNAEISAVKGQRFRFFYDNSNSGTAKSPFILDYNDATFNTNAYFTGNVGIGTTNPTQNLEVTSSGDTRILIYSTGANLAQFQLVTGHASPNTNNWAFAVGRGGTNNFTIVDNLQGERLVINSGGVVNIPARAGALGTPPNGISLYHGLNVGVINCTNTAGAGTDLYIGGSRINISGLGTGLVYSNGGFLTNTPPSDQRLKDDITDLEYGLAEILQLRPVTYNWINDTANQGKQFGFIAQEVQEIMPDLIKEFTITEDEEEVVRLGLDKEGIYATLVNAIKEQNEVLQQLKAEIDLLKQKA
jgi:hypothetical protein